MYLLKYELARFPDELYLLEALAAPALALSAALEATASSRLAKSLSAPRTFLTFSWSAAASLSLFSERDPSAFTAMPISARTLLLVTAISFMVWR